MVKVFNASKFTFQLEAQDGETMKVPCGGFATIQDKFTGDITFRRALAANELQVFETIKQADSLERVAAEVEQDNLEEEKPVVSASARKVSKKV